MFCATKQKSPPLLKLHPFIPAMYHSPWSFFLFFSLNQSTFSTVDQEDDFLYTPCMPYKSYYSSFFQYAKITREPFHQFFHPHILTNFLFCFHIIQIIKIRLLSHAHYTWLPQILAFLFKIIYLIDPLCGPFTRRHPIHFFLYILAILPSSIFIFHNH